MSEPPGILIAAASGRAMASSARRAGYAPFVVDYFADQDTLECAERCVRIEGGLADGSNSNRSWRHASEPSARDRSRDSSMARASRIVPN